MLKIVNYKFAPDILSNIDFMWFYKTFIETAKYYK